MAWIVELTDVTKRHGTTVAVDRLSLQIRRGEFFSLLGPSGSGKTTTLRLLAGFDKPDEGDIIIDGRSMRQVPPQHRPVNTVFQHYALFPHMTVAQNVSFGLEMRGEHRANIHHRVDEALAMVKLSGKESRYPSALSGGEQQRAALARALVNAPSVLLLDEPMSALDQQLRREMQGELQALQAQLGTTFICVTHHQEEALMMSDRVAVMKDGRLLQVGTPRELYEQPADGWVAEFIGLSNSLRGRVTEVQGGKGIVHVASLPSAGPLTVKPIAPFRIGDPVQLVIRPERLRVTRELRSDSGVNHLRARIAQVSYGGAVVQYRLRLSERLEWTACLPNASSEEKPFVTGEEVCVTWKEQDALMVPG
jgi:spermidine/putrescine transport system ATP-binding protein